MRRSTHQKLSNEQVRRIERRRQELGLTRAGFLYKFEEALRALGCVHTIEAAKMRLDRVLNPRMRRPTTDDTKMALAAALGWNVAQFDSAIGILAEPPPNSERSPVNVLGKTAQDIVGELADLSRRLQEIASRFQTEARRRQFR